jgi:hypothetical protein
LKKHVLPSLTIPLGLAGPAVDTSVAETRGRELERSVLLSSGTAWPLAASLVDDADEDCCCTSFDRFAPGSDSIIDGGSLIMSSEFASRLFYCVLCVPSCRRRGMRGMLNERL